MVTTASERVGEAAEGRVAARDQPGCVGAHGTCARRRLRRADGGLQVQHDGHPGGARACLNWRGSTPCTRAARRSAARTTTAFRSLPLTIPPPAEAGTRHARHLYPVLVDKEACGRSREEIADALGERGVGTSIHFRALHLHPFYAERFQSAPRHVPTRRVRVRSHAVPSAVSGDDRRRSRPRDRGGDRGLPLRQCVLFRAAAGPRIGFGHLVRSQRLAAALGIPAVVALDAGPRALDAASVLGCRIVLGARTSLVRTLAPALLIVDHPKPLAGSPWIREARKLGIPTASIHDLGIAPCESDLSVDGSIAPGPMDLAGVKYAIIDPGLRRIRGNRHPSTPPVVLIAFGGGHRRRLARAVARADGRAAVRRRGSDRVRLWIDRNAAG